MRIGIDATLYAPQASGIGRVIVELLNFFSTQTEHTFVAFVRDPIPSDFPRTDAIEYSPVRVQSRWARVAWVFRQAATIDRYALDVWFSANLYLPLRLRIPSVVTIADLSFVDVPDEYPAARRIGYAVLLRAALGATRNVVYTDALKAELQRRYHVDSGRVDVTPLAARSDFKSSRVIPRSLRASTLACYTGSTSRKNGEATVQAFDRIASRFDQLELNLYHAGRLHDETVKAIRRSPHQERIHDLGYVSDAALRELVANAAAFVYPSRAEGFGLPILEAMSLGTPVVCSSLAVHKEVAGDGNALLVDPERHDQLAAALEDVLGDDVVWQRLSDRGVLRARSFSWSSCGERTLQSLVQAVSQRS